MAAPRQASHHEAAAADDRLAADVVGLGGAEEEHRAGRLVGRAATAQRHHPLDRLQEVRVDADVDLPPGDIDRGAGGGRLREPPGRVTGLQISLFDVSDKAHPQQDDRYSFDLPGWAWTEAANDHHAVGYYPAQHVLAIPVSSDGWIEVDRDGDGVMDLGTYRPRTELWVFRVDPNDADPIQLLGQIEHDAEVRRSVQIEDLLYSISDSTVKAHAIQDPKALVGQLNFGREDVGVPVFEADRSDAGVALAIAAPDESAPQVVDIRVGSSQWDGKFVDLLEDQGTGEDLSQSPEILPFEGIDQVKVTFSEDVLVGWTDLLVRGTDGGNYDVVDFTYNAETATGVWTLAKPLGADTVRVRLQDAVADVARNSLDGNNDSRPGGSFAYRFQALPGDVTQDGMVDRADMVFAMEHSSTRLGDAGYLYSVDMDGNGVIDATDFMAIGARTGTALPDASTLPTLQPGDANGDNVFNQHDIVQALQGGKYLTDQPATWSEGDWNRDGRFDQLDIVAALQAGKYAPGGEPTEAVDQLFENADLVM